MWLKLSPLAHLIGWLNPNFILRFEPKTSFATFHELQRLFPSQTRSCRMSIEMSGRLCARINQQKMRIQSAYLVILFNLYQVGLHRSQISLTIVRHDSSNSGVHMAQALVDTKDEAASGSYGACFS